MEPLAGISHEDLLKLVLSIAILLGVARLFGEVAGRLGQPAVVGEILAGVVLGPSVLSGLLPDLGRWIVPDTPLQAQLLDVVGLLGVMFLLVAVGLETDLSLIRARWRTATGVGLGGLVVPFALGLAASFLIPGSLLVDGRRMVFGLFLAVALALSAIPVLARILADLGLLRREFGQTALAAGMIDDIVGWTLLGMVTSLAAAGGLSVGGLALTGGAVVLFAVATIVVARPLARLGLDFVVDKARSRDMTLTLVVVLAFAWGAFSQALHLEPILGAFAIGVVFGQLRRLPSEVVRRLESVTFGVVAPLFLATAGLRLQIDRLLEPRLALITAGLFVVAAAGKLAGGFLGGRYVARTSAREAIGYGIALNARGVLGIVVASIGLSMGILGVEVYSMIVVTSVVTSLMAPIFLRLVFPADTPETDVEREGDVAFRRILLPTRLRRGGRDVHVLEAAAISALAAPAAELTLLTVVTPDQKRDAESHLRGVAALFPRSIDVRRRVSKGMAGQVILEEAGKGYDLIALGAPERGADGEHLFGEVIDEVVRLAPCPSLVFTARGGEWPPRTIMTPTGGSPASARAAELAFALAGGGGRVVLYHVVDPELAMETGLGRHANPGLRIGIAEDMVTQLRSAGERAGVAVSSEVVMGGATTSNIIERARRGVDLVVLGTNVRTGSQRLYLGPKVERLLAESPVSVLVLNV